MPTVTIKSDDQKALNAISQLAHVMQMDVTEVDEEGNEYFYLRGMKIKEASKEMNLSELAGCLSDLDMDPETFRKKAWERNKE